MKATITIEQDHPCQDFLDALASVVRGQKPGAAQFSWQPSKAFGDPTDAIIGDELARVTAILKDTQDHADRYRKLAEESTAANQKLVEDLAKAKLEQRGWRLPKRGDKVRCVSVPTNPSWTEEQKKRIKVGGTYEVACPCGCEFGDLEAYDSEAGAADPTYWTRRQSYGIQIAYDDGSGKAGSRCFLSLPIGCFEPA